MSTVPTPGVTAEEARSIAREAYVYGFPLVDSYRIQHAYFVNPRSPEYKAPWNRLVNMARVYTPEDRAVQTPNSDTPYSMLGLDLRAEPMVLTVPAIDPSRYFSIQFVDAYTHNFDYVGSRATGNGGGSFLVAGPRWSGEAPPGVSRILRAETDFALAIYRTQLFAPDDLANVQAIQAQYAAQPLSAWRGTTPPAAAPAIEFIAPLSPAEQKSSPGFFAILDFVLRFCPIHPSERELRARFAKLGIGGDAGFSAESLPPAIQAALGQGIADAWADFAVLKQRIDAKEVTSGELFGTREALQNNYLYRMAAAVFGIFGNSKHEAIYPSYLVDAEGRKLDGAAGRYRLRFAADGLPPVRAFWSLTMYELPSSLLVANPLDRYLLNAPMLPGFARDPDGGLTLLVQSESPGKDREANWLPAPRGPFFLVLRLYWPGEPALDGTWSAPPLVREG